MPESDMQHKMRAKLNTDSDLEISPEELSEDNSKQGAKEESGKLFTPKVFRSFIKKGSGQVKSRKIFASESSEKQNGLLSGGLFRKNGFGKKLKVHYLIILVLIVVVPASIYLFYGSSYDYIQPDQSQAFDSTLAVEWSEVELGITPTKPERIDLAGITAQSAYVYDPDSYEVYGQREYHEQYHIASITKLMTALVADDYYEWDEEIEAKGDLMRNDYSKILGLKPGDKMEVDDALRAMLIGSYNDAAEALGNSVEGGYSEFIEAMNQKAGEFGMHNTVFSNTSGLVDEGNYSTPRDLQKLIAQFMKNEDLAELVRRPADKIKFKRPVEPEAEEDSGQAADELEYEEFEQVIYTTNRLLDEKYGIVGLKTGYTNWAGQCYVAYYINGEQERVAIVLDSERRFEDAEAMIDRSLSVQ
ncbi:hypothetical protein GF357_04415 [Candidatus Dojkabacteria bacterium]|nr:hypothetical protein [Candidatus Dojkabacteria bacterium]